MVGGALGNFTDIKYKSKDDNKDPKCVFLRRERLGLFGRGFKGDFVHTCRYSGGTEVQRYRGTEVQRYSGGTRELQWRYREITAGTGY